MRPPFASRGAALGFALLVAFCLALPMVIPARLLPPKEESYAAMSDLDPMDYACQQIYHEKTPLNVLFLGSSRIWFDVSSPAVNRFFEAQLHRPCDVQTLGWQRSGFDEAYFILRDLLAHRSVRVVALYREWDQNPIWRTEPHPYLCRACRYAEDRNDLAGVPFQERMAIYGASIFGAPRTLLSLFEPALGIDLGSPHVWEMEQKVFSPNPREYRGCVVAHKSTLGEGFTTWRPSAPPGPEQVVRYSSAPAKFQFGDEMSAYQRAFAAKIGALARAHHVRVVVLHLPSFAERSGALVSEPADWPALFGPQSEVIGISPADFWRGLSEADAARLATDGAHLNANGQAIFTEAIEPALLHFYETSER